MRFTGIAIVHGPWFAMRQASTSEYPTNVLPLDMPELLNAMPLKENSQVPV